MRVELNGTTLNVVQKSASRTTQPTALVFLHYFGGSSGAWTEVCDELSADFHCIAPDLRGCGDSAAPASGYSVGELADDVAALIESFKLERYALIGHSMGGKIALALAARRPPGLDSLVLLAPSPPTPEPIEPDERARLLAAHGDRAAAEETARKIVARPLAPQMFERVVADSLRTSPAAWRAWLEHGSREDLSPPCRDVRAPLAVIVGAADVVLPADLQERELVRRVTGARLIIIPGEVGHLLPLEAPATTAKLIRESLVNGGA